MDISLKPITLENWEACVELSVGITQLGQVATNMRSLAEASVRDNATTLGIYEQDTLIGFVMLVVDEHHEYEIHRFMIDFHYQGKGYGSEALRKIIEYIRELPGRASRIKIMFLVENSQAERLYKKIGFVDSGLTEWNEKWRFREKIFYYTL